MGLRRYRIDRYLTEGGMGAIYVGRKLGAGGFEREVVLKQLLPEFIDRPEFRDLFFREAKISAGLDHVNIVRTFDLVRSEDALFIVMEYVAGTDLRTITWRARAARKRVSIKAVLHIGMEILAGLAYAHARCGRGGRNLGIVHRDVSPSNIICSGQGDVKISDFGIAKASSFSSVFYRVRGKVGYMSPEQARNQPLDGRSDLYSLAVCLFEAFSGQRLFVGDLQTPPDEIYGRPLPALRTLRPDLPSAIEAVLLRALSESPGDRFASAQAFSQALREAARKHDLLYSAGELAAELRGLLGHDPERWSQDDHSPLATGETEKLAVARSQLAQAASPAPPQPPLDAPIPEPGFVPPPRPASVAPVPPGPAAPAPSRPVPKDTLEALPLPSSSHSLPTVEGDADFERDVDPRPARQPRRSTFALWLVILFVVAAGAVYVLTSVKTEGAGGAAGATSAPGARSRDVPHAPPIPDTNH